MAAIVSLLTMAMTLAPARGNAASKWMRMHTAHFELVGDVGQSALARVGARFEQFRETFGSLFPNLRHAAAPVVIVVFRSKRAYEPFMPLFNGKRVDVGGYFLSRPGQIYITMTLDGSDEDWRVIFHEYTHLLVGASLAEVPVWFNEGLAEYYSTFRAESNGRKGSIGMVIENHIFQLRERFIPLRELMAVRHDSPLYNEGDRRSIFYAESWAMLHYFMVGKPQRMPQLVKYLERYSAGASSDVAFREAFGEDEAALERELRLYVAKSIFQSITYTLKDPIEIDRNVKAAPMSEADGAAVLGDLLLQTQRLDEATTHLEQARSLDPALPRAAASLGRVRHLQSRDEDALKLLNEGVERAGDDYLPLYYLATTLLRPEKGPLVGLPPDRAAAARAVSLLERVVAQQASLADAYALLGYARLVTGERSAAVTAYSRAYEISPRQEYALMVAQAHAGNRDAAKARNLLNALVEHGESDSIRQRAADLLERLRAIDHALAGDGPSTASSRSSPNPLTSTASTSASPAGEPRETPVFRRVDTGETREAGVLQEIACSREAIVLVVSVAGRELRVGAPEFINIDFISFRSDLKGGVSCGRRAAPETVYVTWRAGGPPGTAGRAVAVEFLPAGFKP
jgi:tetratricopeptide (TPR) repeat protein